VNSTTKSEFLNFLQLASGTHAFAVSGLAMVRSVAIARMNKDVNNPDSMTCWADANPNIPGSINSRPGWRTSELIQNLENNGISARYLGWAWAVLVFDRWEDDYRSRFARELGCSHDHVFCDAIGDLNKIRNDISHNKGIASREKSGKCKLIQHWFTIGDEIDIDQRKAAEFYDLIASDENAIYIETQKMSRKSGRPSKAS
jgi:hypothetical protein